MLTLFLDQLLSPTWLRKGRGKHSSSSSTAAQQHSSSSTSSSTSTAVEHTRKKKVCMLGPRNYIYQLCLEIKSHISNLSRTLLLDFEELLGEVSGFWIFLVFVKFWRNKCFVFFVACLRVKLSKIHKPPPEAFQNPEAIPEASPRSYPRRLYSFFHRMFFSKILFARGPGFLCFVFLCLSFGVHIRYTFLFYILCFYIFYYYLLLRCAGGGALPSSNDRKCPK